MITANHQDLLPLHTRIMCYLEDVCVYALLAYLGKPQIKDSNTLYANKGYNKGRPRGVTQL